MMFVTLKDMKSEVPLSEIKLVEEGRGELVNLTMKDGSYHETYRHLWLHGTRYHFQQVLPALPGTYLICEVEDEGYQSKHFEPVLGWAIHAARGILPLTHYGTPDEDSPHVLHPDGRITNTGGGVYADMAEFLAMCARRDALKAA